MSDIITIPTVEQINLEHRLANSKAIEAVQHATNCGLMLLQIKTSLNHGEWLPWLNGEIESGDCKSAFDMPNALYKAGGKYDTRVVFSRSPSIRAFRTTFRQRAGRAAGVAHRF